MKTKILFILHLPPPIHGASMMSKRIKNSNIINSNFSTNYINLATSFSLKEIGKHSKGKLGTLLKIQIDILKALLNTRYDICYITLTAKGPGFYKDLLVVLLLKIFRKKIVFHFHNKGVKANSNTWYKRLCYRFVFHKTKCIMLSPLLYDDISNYIKRENIYYCANGIPEIKLISQKRVSNELCSFLFLSNMMREKGVLTLLKACQILATKNLKFTCNFVGDWSDIDAELFQSKVETLAISELVYAHGKKYGADKYPFLEQANVFVHPTHEDCFPLVLLEAMQYGLPIIASDEGAIPEIVIEGESGYVIQKNNAEELASKMEKFINHSELRKEMGDLGKRYYNESFTFQRFENRLSSILNEINIAEK